MVLGSLLGLNRTVGGLETTCGDTVNVPQGGKCKVIFTVYNTGYLDATIDYSVDILDKNGIIVGSASDYSGITIAKGDYKMIATSDITIKPEAPLGLGSARVVIFNHETGEELARASCNIVNIVSGVAVTIGNISVAVV